MPRKREPIAPEDVENEIEIAVELAPQKAICGHVNRHSFGVDGKPDNPTCFLEAGHTPPHKGKHLRRNYRYDRVGKKFVSVFVGDVEEIAEWHDGAGEVPTSFPPEIPAKTLAEEDFGENAKAILAGLS